MADLASTDVTVTVVKRGLLGRDKLRRCTVAFGDGALTVPATGVPLPAANVFGLSRILDMMISPNETGYVYKYDSTNHSIRIYQGVSGSVALTGDALATHVHDIRVIGGITEDEPVGLLSTGPTLGKLAATNRIVAGADQATKGGVVPITAGTPSGTVTLTAAPLSHATASAPAATTLIVYAVGR